MKKSKNIESITLEIQEMISVFTKESFICFFTDFIRNHPNRSQEGFSSKLKSKLKDSLFLIALRLSSKKEGSIKLRISESNNTVLENVANKLNDMLFLYLDENFKNAYLQNVKQKDKLFVHEATFKNYFLNGKLNYREQEIAHIRRLFHPYNDLIIKRIGLDLNTLISLCDYSEEIYKKKTLTLSHSDIDFISRIKKIASEENANQIFEKELENLSDSFLDYMENPHSNFLFAQADFYEKFNPKEVSIFCDLFSISINDNLEFFYYTQNNPLDNKPIIKISNNTYLQIYNKQLPASLYNLLYKTLTQTPKEASKLNHRRGKKVFEEHVSNLFVDFFKKDSHYEVYRNFYIEGSSNEKDILIVSQIQAFYHVEF